MPIRVRSKLSFFGFLVTFVALGLLSQSALGQARSFELISFLFLVPLFILGLAVPLLRCMMRSSKYLENEPSLERWKKTHGPLMGPFREWLLGIDQNGQMVK